MPDNAANIDEEKIAASPVKVFESTLEWLKDEQRRTEKATKEKPTYAELIQRAVQQSAELKEGQQSSQADEVPKKNPGTTVETVQSLVPSTLRTLLTRHLLLALDNIVAELTGDGPNRTQADTEAGSSTGIAELKSGIERVGERQDAIERAIGKLQQTVDRTLATRNQMDTKVRRPRRKIA